MTRTHGYIACALIAVALVLLNLLSDGHCQEDRGSRIEEELNTIYGTKQAEPDLTYRGTSAERIERLAVRQVRYLLTTLHPWEKDPSASLLTTGNSNENGIRPNAHTIASLATIYRCFPDECFSEDFTREQCLDTTLDMLRFVLPTHGEGGVTCMDDKQWKDQWQSALWAYSIGIGCWLIWDDLPEDMKWLATNMVTHEADRFVGVRPPARIEYDTKAEENAWNSKIISLAWCMFPNHPHNKDWQETAKRWIISSFVREADLTADPTIDGRPLSQWDVGATIHDDYTLENHSIVHPDYTNTFTILLNQIPAFDWAGIPAPEGLRFAAEGMYRNLKNLAFPDGGYVYLCSQDWRLHRNPDWLDTHAQMMLNFQDPQAARLFLIGLETAEKMMERTPDDSMGIHLPGEYFFASAQQMILGKFAYIYLMLRSRGEGPEPVSESLLWNRLSGKRLWEAGKVGIRRSEQSISTFSWGKRVMGLVMPLQKDLLLSPYPYSLIGDIVASAKQKAPVEVKEVKVHEFGDEFGVIGVLGRADDQVQQRFCFVTLPDDRTVYLDEVQAVSPEAILEMRLGEIVLLNEPDWVYHLGFRTVYHSEGMTLIHAVGDDQAPIDIESSWLNIDDEMGIVCLDKSMKQRYIPNHKQHRGRLDQPLYLNYISGEHVSESAVITALAFYPGRSKQETQSLAGKVILNRSNERAGITMEDGTVIIVDWNNLGISVQ